MKYNEIYELVKPIYKWLEEHYPHDKYLKIDKNGFTLCEEKFMGINKEESTQNDKYNIASLFKELTGFDMKIGDDSIEIENGDKNNNLEIDC